MDNTKANITKFHLANLDCANCARKIEDGVKTVPGVRYASVNFATSTLYIDGDDIDSVKNKINQIEPDVSLQELKPLEKGLSSKEKSELWMIGLSAILFAIGLVFNQQLTDLPYQIGIWVVLGAAYVLSGYRVVVGAVRNIARGNWFDETFLMTVATIGAVVIGELHEAVGVMLFYMVGEFVQERSVKRSRNEIQALLDIKPESAHVLTDNGIIDKEPEGIEVGEVLVIKPGERVPLDGEVVEGTSQIDASMLTGESIPVDVKIGDEVFGGTINQGGMIKVQVTKLLSQSSLSKMLDLVQNAASRKAKTEKFITKFAKVYSPIMVGLAALVAFLPPLFVPGQVLSDWVYRALVLLVISCPCALVISIPLGYFGGLGGASRKGILVKGANFLDVLADVKTIVFDKTGTLTKGKLKVSEIVPYNGVDEKELLTYTAFAEAHSSHPVAQAIRTAYGKNDLDAIDVGSYQEIAGYGVIAEVNGHQVIVGNDGILHRETVAHVTCDVPGTVVHTVLDSQYIGYIVVEDEIKPDAREVIGNLRNAGVDRVYMLSGDREDVAEKVAEELGLDQYWAELLPEDKVSSVDGILDAGHDGKLAFVGDGINDAPALARADVGIAMGAFGSDAAIETADVVLMTDALDKIAQAIEIGKKTRKIVWQNIGLAFMIKTVFIVLGIFGIASMGGAVFADVGVALLAVMNATRILR